MTAFAFAENPTRWAEEDRETLLSRASLHRIDLETAWETIEIADLEAEAETLVPVLLALFAATNEGSLCLPLDEAKLAKSLSRFAETPEQAGEWARNALADLRSGKWRSLVGSDPDAYLPIRQVVEASGEYLYFQKYDAKEKRLIEDFNSLVEAGLPVISPAEVSEILREILVERPILYGESPVDFNLQQRAALALSPFQPVLIVSGGPGTGKTSIAAAILRTAVRLGIPASRIRLAAPTGRAANRMSESIGLALSSIEDPTEADRSLLALEGLTLHRLLEFGKGGLRFARHRYNPVPADFVVVDEASMVDVCLMADLIAAVRPGARLVLLGDKDQLPSVDAGAVLGNLLPGVRKTCLSAKGKERTETVLQARLGDSVEVVDSRIADRVVILDVSYRSEARILELAERINLGDASAADLLAERPLPVRSEGESLAVDWPANGRPEEGGFRWIDADSDGGLRAWGGVVDSWIERNFLESEEGVREFVALTNSPVSTAAEKAEETNRRLERIFAWVNRSRILCLVRKGPYGVESVNRRVVEKMRQETAPRIRGDLFPGLPILILKNEHELGVFNGDVGVVLRTEDRALRAWFPRGGGFVSFPIASLPHFEPAYAVTVHKSQGSEYDRVLMVLPEESDHRLLTREIVYTGLTRAKSLAVLFGRKESLRAAVSRKIERASARSLWDRPTGAEIP